MEEKNPLNEIFLRSDSNGSDNEKLSSNMRERKKRQEKYDLYKLRLHSREYMMHKSVSQPSFCSPGFGTSKRFNSEKGTEQSFHESMPGPGYYAKVVTGSREETNAAAEANIIPMQTTLKSSTLKNTHSNTKEDIERQEREQDLLRKDRELLVRIAVSLYQSCLISGGLEKMLKAHQAQETTATWKRIHLGVRLKR